jgi:hypothetical protein
MPAYPLRDDSWWKFFMIDSISLSLFFLIVQYTDNGMTLQCYETVAGKLPPVRRRLALFFVYFILFLW